MFESSTMEKIKSATVTTARVLLVPSDRIDELEQKDIEDSKTDADREQEEALRLAMQ